ncbi:MAG: MauE/DoxX family redox-associated membrane protein [Acidimicrobiales bacterium]
MAAYLHPFGLAYLAATLVASGGGHLAAFSTTVRVIGEHRVVPGAAATLVAGALVTVELGLAAAAVAALAGGLDAAAPAILAAGAATAGAFLLYLWRLLRAPVRPTSCGCSPIPARLTPLAALPAAVLLLACATGLASATFDPPASLAALYEWAGVGASLPVMAGATLAVLVLLYPSAITPAPSTARP